MIDVTEGAQFTAPYPFKRDKKSLLAWDEGGSGGYDVACWTPGTECDHDAAGNPWHVADGSGFVRYTVVSVHRPASWPTRVFYVREWIDPDGKVFGADRLRVTTLGWFRRLCRGYRYNDVVFSDAKEAA